MNLSDDSKKVREILALRASGWTIMALSIRYTKDRTSIRHHLIKYDVTPLTSVVDVRIERPIVKHIPKTTGKYDYLFDEPINEGKSYHEYVEAAKKRHPKESHHKVPIGKRRMNDILVDTCF